MDEIIDHSLGLFVEAGTDTINLVTRRHLTPPEITINCTDKFRYRCPLEMALKNGLPPFATGAGKGKKSQSTLFVTLECIVLLLLPTTSFPEISKDPTPPFFSFLFHLTHYFGKYYGHS